MYATSVVMFMTQRKAIRTTASLPELHSKTSPTIGFALCAELEKKISLL